jgi:hypothetical protein
MCEWTLQLSVGACAYCLLVSRSPAHSHFVTTFRDSAAHTERSPQNRSCFLSLAFAWLTCTFTLGYSPGSISKRANKLVSAAAGLAAGSAHQWPGAHRQAATALGDRTLIFFWQRILLLAEAQFIHSAKPTRPGCRTCPVASDATARAPARATPSCSCQHCRVRPARRSLLGTA